MKLFYIFTALGLLIWCAAALYCIGLFRALLLGCVVALAWFIRRGQLRGDE